MSKKERFDTGLRRLLKSSESVVDMQQELEELKPKLIVKVCMRRLRLDHLAVVTAPQAQHLAKRCVPQVAKWPMRAQPAII